MKFGHQLKTSLYPEWVFYYLSYDSLKAELKARLTKNLGGWTEDDESAFAELLEKELDKVYSFQKVKSGEIMRRLQHAKQEVEEIIQSHDAHNEDYALLEEELSHIIADVHDLAKFTRLNYTGFLKIIKKHDVSFSFSVACVLFFLFVCLERYWCCTIRKGREREMDRERVKRFQFPRRRQLPHPVVLLSCLTNPSWVPDYFQRMRRRR